VNDDNGYDSFMGQSLHAYQYIMNLSKATYTSLKSKQYLINAFFESVML